MGGFFWCHPSKLSRSDILRKHGKTGYRLKSFYNALYMFLRPCGLGGDNKTMKMKHTMSGGSFSL